MIPAAFDYVAPATLNEAVGLLTQHQDDAKILAGGHSLIPAMKLRLAQPALLIDIGRIKDLAYINEDDRQIRIGAMTTHYEIESSARLKEICPLLPECAVSIGDVQVRNKGTIGGSIAHADPSADWPAAILALDAEMIAVSAQGERTIRAADFFVDMLTTALEPNEILREIRIAQPKGRTGQAYVKVAQPASGFAVVGVAVSLTRGDDGRCQSASVGITGVSAKAYRAGGVENVLTGSTLDEQAIAAAAAHAADNVDANADLYASAEYRRHLAQVHTRRAIQQAIAKL
ncbi:MAG: aerobic carbon-monoxide dehydrogenase medium subunit [Acidobacteriota bacterium]|jgi:carbon-monoxide dehydrogenase medium subunit|nr:aerobic carbon-monoxide dehydrogenase medium subunit [Acidobacteriota bacterium]